MRLDYPSQCNLLSSINRLNLRFFNIDTSVAIALAMEMVGNSCLRMMLLGDNDDISANAWIENIIYGQLSPPYFPISRRHPGWLI